MTRERIEQLYFNWLYAMIIPQELKDSYRQLCRCLHDMNFRFSVPMDMNREEDGLYLRWRFADDTAIDTRIVSALLDSKPCSVLEMMAALALRCEEAIMSDPAKGDRTALWFWCMIQNLGLDSMTDRYFDEAYTSAVVNRMLDRQYAPDGSGGLFLVKHCRHNMRNAEIWYQLCWYMDELLHEMED